MPLPINVVKNGDVVSYKGQGEILLFVPDFYFNMKLAVIEGEYVTLLGVLDYAISRKVYMEKYINFIFHLCLLRNRAR